MRAPVRMSLVGSTYRVNLDFGRETGTWMPPRWAINAGRTEYTLDLTFEDAGVATELSAPAATEESTARDLAARRGDPRTPAMGI